jgi:DNA-binding YbaB/EbfC family protein
MFEMFKGMGAMAGLLGNLPKLKAEMEKLQRKMNEIVAEADAGAGMVKVKCNGRMEVVSVTIGEEALKDRELLEDLIRGATNVALMKAKQQVAEETNRVAMELGLPPGMGLPGIG